MLLNWDGNGVGGFLGNLNRGFVNSDLQARGDRIGGRGDCRCLDVQCDTLVGRETGRAVESPQIVDPWFLFGAYLPTRFPGWSQPDRMHVSCELGFVRVGLGFGTYWETNSLATDI